MALPRIKTKEELVALVEQVGFLPLFDGTIPGFSARGCTPGAVWFTDDTLHDPWAWRKEIAAEGRLVYGKFLEKKAAFFTREAFALLAGLRRDGYEFDTLYEDGKASRRQKKIMDLLSGDAVVPGYRLRAMGGFGKEGERGFEGAVTALQAQTYLVVRALAPKRNKAGKEYGWPVNHYSRAEALLGEGFAEAYYTVAPARCLDELAARLCRAMPEVSVEEARHFLK